MCPNVTVAPYADVDMYLITDTVLVTSASDLTLASDCEFGFLRVPDHRMNWSTDPLISRAKWAAYLLFTPALLDCAAADCRRGRAAELVHSVDRGCPY